jgi:hypothetical protein
MSAEVTALLLRLEQETACLRTELIEIKAMIQAGAAAPEKRKGLSVQDACELTGLRSRSAFVRWAKKNKVTPYAPGRYFSDAVQTAMARGGFRGFTAKARTAPEGSPC